MEDKIITKVKKAISKFDLVKERRSNSRWCLWRHRLNDTAYSNELIKNDLKIEIGVATFNHKIRPTSYEDTQIVKRILRNSWHSFLLWRR